MPCSQMISMNMSPPRPMLASNEERLPAVKARILNRQSEHGVRGPALDEHKGNQQDQTAAQAAEHERAHPAHVE
jgi:hypothetical protein